MAEKQTEKAEEPTLAQVLSRLLDVQAQAQGIQAAQLKQTRAKSNAAVPNISVFNPRGQKDHPMAELKCEIQPFNQTPQDHGFTREEVELINALEPGLFRLELNDGSTVVCELVGQRNVYGKLERLSFYGTKDLDSGQYGSLFNAETKARFTSLVNLLRQMLEQQGTDHSGVMSMRKERELIASGQLAISLGE